MKKIRSVIFLGLCVIFGTSDLNVIAQESPALEQETSEADLEIIANLDFLDDMEIFNEELNFLENYDVIYQSEEMGDSDE